MKLFKSLDDKLEELGFIKEEESELFCRYVRNKKDFIQYVDLCHKKSGRHILQSYDKDLFDSKSIGNTCVGLTAQEMKLFRKKMIRKFGNYK